MTQLRCLIFLMAILLPLTASCGGDAGKYAGTWKRDLYGEGEVQMKLASNGGIELMLPSPRWPDTVDMKGRGRFKGDTLIFNADTAARACQTTEARYVVSMEQDQLRIAGLGADNCGGRRAALVGTWEKS